MKTNGLIEINPSSPLRTARRCVWSGLGIGLNGRNKAINLRARGRRGSPRFAPLDAERNGFSPRIFSSPNEFLLSPGFDRYDCLVIDLGLPGMSGLELLELLRARGDATPAVLIAAAASPQLEPRSRKAGASEVLLKPFAPRALLESLEKAIRVRSAEATTYVGGTM